jgi:hypothetical protein
MIQTWNILLVYIQIVLISTRSDIFELHFLLATTLPKFNSRDTTIEEWVKSKL